jgi:hypothetical protein
MELAESRESAALGPSVAIAADISNSSHDLLADGSLVDDGRSSSLSDIEYVSSQEPSDDELALPKPDRGIAEIDSEAETERIDDSPRNNIRARKDIVVTANRLENSPSKLAQSTTYDNVEDDEDAELEDTPSKARRSSGNDDDALAEEFDEPPAFDDPSRFLPPRDLAGKKRKRLHSGDDTGTEAGEDGPLKKRRASLKSDLGEDEAVVEPPLSPEPVDDGLKLNEVSNRDTPADETPDRDISTTPAAARGKKGRKGKRKGRRIKDMDEETDTGGVEPGTEGAPDDPLPDDEDAGEAGEEGDDAEAVAKSEEEMAKKMAAMESLSVLEKEFATLRDRIYDERIAKLNRELEQLSGPEPTHPEFLRQLECVKRHCDAKVQYEHTLFQYRLKSLLTKSLAERAQVLSTYHQRIRDVRERHSSTVSRRFYAIQHDRFKAEDINAHHFLPFPARRSQQVAQQTAYNQEVSIMAGIAKHVGFPAAPSLSSARPSEIEDDLGKMGISMETKPMSSELPRGTVAINAPAAPRITTDETSWTNPQLPLQQQQHQPVVRQHGRAAEQCHGPPSFTTPAAQKRVIDIHAPNGSASTIVENPSAPNSSATNTPYGIEQESQSRGQVSSLDHDAPDGKNALRSQSSSPLDVRKAQLHSSRLLDTHQAAPEIRSESASRNHHSGNNSGNGSSSTAIAYAPSTRLGLFGSSSKREPSPPRPLKPVNTMHPSSIATNASVSRMAAR